MSTVLSTSLAEVKQKPEYKTIEKHVEALLLGQELLFLYYIVDKHEN